MKPYLLTAFLLVLPCSPGFGQSSDSDWLIDNRSFRTKDGGIPGSTRDTLQLSNGIATRRFLCSPTFTTIGLVNEPLSENLVRAIRPEATVTLNGTEYLIGHLQGQPNHAFLKEEWLDKLKVDPNGFQFKQFGDFKPEARFAWKKVRHFHAGTQWPPKGRGFYVGYTCEKLPGILVKVHYELYDGIPCFCKWITIENQSDKAIKLDRFSTENLAVVEKTNWVEAREGVDVPRPTSIHVETDFAFGGFNHANANRHVVHWETDPQYQTQVNYLRKTPCLLRVSPTYGPAQLIPPGETFESYRTFELIHDSADEERQNLALRKMYRTVAPWVTENPIMLHLKASKPEVVRQAIDQCAEVGFEMVVLSFGSGFNIENENENYIDQWKEIKQYAQSKGIEIGGYSLLSSRRIGGGNDIVSPMGQKPTHGNCPALTSAWGQKYFKTIKRFFEKTGFALLEHDGSYPGDVDTTRRPPFQEGELDSRWAQWKVITGFYQWCRSRGIYLNVPDYYFLSGANKCGMGYREVNWSLPREQQVIHTRQNIFDGTRTKTPSMGWMFVPLTQYHGGGAAATVEPLCEHLDHYELMMASNFGAGVQACYRGPRIYDTEKTRERVKVWVDWFKKHRTVLESDIIHSSSRRADGMDIDWILHANPGNPECGMLVVYNPLDKEIKKDIPLNLYYTGIEESAEFESDCPFRVEGKGDNEKGKSLLKVDRRFRCKLPVSVPARGVRAFVIRKGDSP